MKTTAAILVEISKPLELVELEIPPLCSGQVLVEIAFSGVCRTQLLECQGHKGPDPYLPHCLGHEGSGTVVDVGPDVTRCKTGDRVVLSWIKAGGADVPGTVYDLNGQTVNAGGVTTFSRHAVVSENRVSKLSSKIGLQEAALLGCAVPTGMGMVFNTARVQEGQSVAVFGTGGIGLLAVAAAAIARAKTIVAVDVNSQRLRLAEKMGATHTVDASASDSVEQLRVICPGGVDIAIEASGRTEVMAQALASVRMQGGTAVVAGNAQQGKRLEIDPHQLNLGKRLLGTWGGDNEVDRDFPRYQQLLVEDRLRVEPLLSTPLPLTEINEALEDLQQGRVARPMIDMSLE